MVRRIEHLLPRHKALSRLSIYFGTNLIFKPWFTNKFKSPDRCMLVAMKSIAAEDIDLIFRRNKNSTRHPP
jgi:hypothetical protein